MTDRTQLAAALGRLDPRHREVLDYSLRRRVPDDDLVELFSGSPGDVARLRAAAIERLSEDLGVQRGAELGSMLRELLDPGTWELVPSADDPAPARTPEPEPEPAEPIGPIGAASPPGPIGASPRSHRPVGASDATEQEASSPDPNGLKAEEAPSLQAEEAPSQADRVAPPEPDVPDARGSGVRLDRAPVLDMLAGGGSPGGDRSSRRSGSRRVAMGLAVALAVLAPAGIVAALSLGEDLGLANGDDGESESASGSGTGIRPFAPEPEAVGEPFPSDPDSAFDFPVARVSGKTALYDEPGGTVKVRIAARTEWRSPRVLGIVDQRDGWLAVLAPELRNGEVGWIPQESVDRLEAVTWSVRADLSKRVVVVRRGSEVVRRFRVGVGRAGHSTPTGRFAVTDKLRVSDESSPYGCCVVALTGHQTRLPEGWPGGDRLAIHATSDETGLGRAVSLGCMRSRPAVARWLMETLPLGTPVFIRR